MDDLSISLNNSGIGGHIGEKTINQLCYIWKQESPEITLIIAIIGLFLTVFSIILVKFFCKVSWSAYNNITYTEIWQKLF